MISSTTKNFGNYQDSDNTNQENRATKLEDEQ